MHLINLMVNCLYRKYGVPLHIFFPKIGPEVQATLNSTYLELYSTYLEIIRDMCK